MCLIENKVKPKGAIFYKVFALRYNKLCWLFRDDKAETSWGKIKVEGNKFESTKEGFHVWKDKRSAKKFTKLVPRILSRLKNIKLVIKKVKCSKLIKAGTCIAGTKDNTGNFWDEKNAIREQAFAFNVMDVLK